MVDQKTFQKLFNCTKKASDLRNTHAMINLAVCFENEGSAQEWCAHDQ